MNDDCIIKNKKLFPGEMNNYTCLPTCEHINIYTASASQNKYEQGK